MFKKAASMRQEDVSGPTVLNKSVTDPRTWRNGSSYSPNFAAAYSAYRMSMKIADDNDRNSLLKTVATEFDALVKKGQLSRETQYFLVNTYRLLRDEVNAQRIEAVFASDAAIKKPWQIDKDVMTSEEYAMVYGVAAAPANTEPKVPIEPTKPVDKPVDKPAPDKAEEARALAALTGAAPATDDSWVVQLGAYKEEGRVKLLLSKVKQLGLPAFTENVETPQGARTRVRAGPFKTREAADKARERIAKIGVDGPVARK